jgi:hypothetical protein
MPKALPYEEDGKVTGYMIFCPACKCGHLFNTVPNGKRPVWKFINGDANSPTFRASMLVKSGHYAGPHKKGDECWCTFKKRYGTCEFTCSICHSHVTDGRIEFCKDSTHELSGKTVDLPDWDDLNKGA